MYTRNCPECKQEIAYKSKHNCSYAERDNRLCKKCQFKGERNPFFGKTHTEETKKKILANRDFSVYKTDEFRSKMKQLVIDGKTGMTGRSVYSVWVEKYGKEEADKRLEQFKIKTSKNNSGKNNPMYGKPAPNGAGNGWKGWYKSVFFRSLRELMFMIENDGLFQSAEKIRISYQFNGKNRTYAPDFIVGNRLIEIKPAKLHDSPNNLAKFAAAKDFCDQNGLTFKVIDVKIDVDLITANLQYIVFQSNYLERFQKWIKN